MLLSDIKYKKKTFYNKIKVMLKKKIGANINEKHQYCGCKKMVLSQKVFATVILQKWTLNNNKMTLHLTLKNIFKILWRLLDKLNYWYWTQNPLHDFKYISFLWISRKSGRQLFILLHQWLKTKYFQILCLLLCCCCNSKKKETTFLLF